MTSPFQKEMSKTDLPSNEDSFHAMADSTPVMIWQSGFDGLCTFVNEAWLEFTGRSVEQELGEGWAEGVYPDDLQKCLAIYSTSFQKRLNFHMEYRLRRADGAYRWILDMGMPKYTLEGVFEGYVGSAVDITLYKQVEQNLREMGNQLEIRVNERTAELANVTENLRNLATRLQAAREEERTRVAREVHDHLSQELTVLKLDLTSFEKIISPIKSSLPPESRDRIRSMVEGIDSMIKSAVKICTELRPGILDEFGLVAAMEWQAQEFQKRFGIDCHLILDPDAEIDDKVRSIAMFRAFQEMLNNVARHARATQVQIDLTRRDSLVTLAVRDNGCGIPNFAEKGNQALGLLGIRERVTPLGGKFMIQGFPGKGTTATIEMPWRKN